MKLNLLTFGDHLPDPVTGETTTVAERHNGIVESFVAADAAGFFGANLGEHHVGNFVSSNPPVTLAAVAGRTSALRLGTAVTLLANLDPLRVAEDYATLDVLSGGRVDVVVGRGNLFPATYEVFGQQLDDSRQLFEENIELLLRLWTENDVTWKGLGRPPLNSVTLNPKPVQTPHPPLWIGGGGSPETAELAARLGLPLALPSAFADPSRFAPVVEAFVQRWQELQGVHATRPSIAASWHMHVERDSARAKQRWEPRYAAYHQWFGDQVRLHNPDYVAPRFDYEWMLTSGSALAGSPAEVVDKLGRLAERLQADTHLVYLDMGGAPLRETLEMIELIGSDVIPQLP
jgi:alkanesulfonate monooxygenase SsuD/methylene tetrahydromethanopterin reductase-like flavin-dependent oxidoreductase (luciferase family)